MNDLRIGLRNTDAGVQVEVWKWALDEGTGGYAWVEALAAEGCTAEGRLCALGNAGAIKNGAWAKGRLGAGEFAELRHPWRYRSQRDFVEVRTSTQHIRSTSTFQRKF